MRTLTRRKIFVVLYSNFRSLAFLGLLGFLIRQLKLFFSYRPKCSQEMIRLVVKPRRTEGLNQLASTSRILKSSNYSGKPGLHELNTRGLRPDLNFITSKFCVYIYNMYMYIHIYIYTHASIRNMLIRRIIYYSIM